MSDRAAIDPESTMDFLVRHRRGHVDAVRDAMRVSDDEAGAVVGLGFENALSVCSSFAPWPTLAT